MEESIDNAVDEAVLARGQREEDAEDEEQEHPTVVYIELPETPGASQTGGSASMNEREEEHGKRGGEACSTSSSPGNEWNRSNFDGLLCPICMEAWTNGGEHHICCLPCGHLYGFSCIKKWLEQRRGSGKCPQCNSRCSLKGVRKLFSSHIATVDDESHKIIRSLETKLAVMENKDADWCRKEAVWKRIESALRSEISQLKKKTTYLEGLVENERNKASGFSAFRGSSQEEYLYGHHKMLNGQSPCTFLSQGELQVSGGRLFDIDASSQILLLARRLSGISGNYVLTQMSLVPPYEIEDILLPPGTRAIKDLRISPNNNGLALFGSLEKKLSIISMDSHNIILSYYLPAFAWSCSWDLNSSHLIYAGLQNGMLLVFDMRQTAGPLLSLSGLTRNPIHSLHPLSGSSFASPEIPVLSASSIGVSRWTTCGSSESSSLVPETRNPGVCISSARCPLTDNMVVSYRPKVELSDDIAPSQQPLSPSVAIGSRVHGSHVHFRRVGHDSYQNVGSVNASVDNIRLPKTAIINLSQEKQLFVSCDESTNEIMLQELPSFQIFQRFKAASHPAYDVKYAHVLGRGLLGCLSEDRIQLFTTRPS